MNIKKITKLLSVLEDITDCSFTFEVITDNSILFKMDNEVIGSFHSLESFHTYLLVRAFNTKFIKEGI